MSETLRKLEIDKLRKMAETELHQAGGAYTDEDVKEEIRDLEEEIKHLEGVLKSMKEPLAAKKRDQLETVLAVCQQYGLPVPDDVQALADQEKVKAPKPKSLPVFEKVR